MPSFNNKLHYFLFSEHDVPILLQREPKVSQSQQYARVHQFVPRLLGQIIHYVPHSLNFPKSGEAHFVVICRTRAESLLQIRTEIGSSVEFKTKQ